MALAFLLPLIIVVAIAVRLDSADPAFFRQTREGLNGSAFQAFKFRTMRLDAGDASGIVHTVRGDSRVPRVGRFLRRTSIGELPHW